MLTEQSSDINIILLTNKIFDVSTGGRELLCKLNRDVLKNLYGEQCAVYEISKRPINGKFAIVNAFRGYFDGLNASTIASALMMIESNNPKKVFVDGSNLGAIVKLIKLKFPQIEVSTFFHNVEARFFLGAFRQAMSIRSFAVFIINYLAEKKSVKYSDKIICLNERDSHLLEKFYKRKATHISAMAMEDKLPVGFDTVKKSSLDNFVLFVGGSFYANKAGIYWFVKNVSPNITMKTYIVGKGLEEFKTELESYDNVRVIGEVESLSQWYYDSKFVIAPIFDGSGMKTKIAEALMHGKKVVGTPEAFSGYEDIVNSVGWRCETAEQFINAIEVAQQEIGLSFDPVLRNIYEEKYSFSSCKFRFSRILES